MCASIHTNGHLSDNSKSLLASLWQVGISHHDFGVDARSRFALKPPAVEELSHAIMRTEEVHGVVILSTCNRTEFFFDGGTKETALKVLAEYYGLDKDILATHFSTRTGWEVVRHLFRLASGLESMVLGETQINAQIKQAMWTSDTEGYLSPLLAKTFQGAMKTGKRVRRETAISTGAASIAYTALLMARNIFHDLSACSALVIGTGDMGRNVVYNLREKGLTELAVTNRTAERGQAFAAKVGGTFIPFERLRESVNQYDIVITCTAAGQTIITPDMVKPLATGSRLYLDLSVPANIDRSVGDLQGIRHTDLDAIQNHISKLMVAREDEIPKAEAVVTEELLSFQYKQILDLASPAILRLQEDYEQIRREELDRLDAETDGQLRSLLDTLSRRLVKRLMVRPLEIFKEEAETDTISLTQVLDGGQEPRP